MSKGKRLGLCSVEVAHVSLFLLEATESQNEKLGGEEKGRSAKLLGFASVLSK